jgi:hypothetical protein
MDHAALAAQSATLPHRRQRQLCHLHASVAAELARLQAPPEISRIVHDALLSWRAAEGLADKLQHRGRQAGRTSMGDHSV